MKYIVIVLILLAVIGYVLYRLAKTNTDVKPTNSVQPSDWVNDFKRLPPRQTVSGPVQESSVKKNGIVLSDETVKNVESNRPTDTRPVTKRPRLVRITPGGSRTSTSARTHTHNDTVLHAGILAAMTEDMDSREQNDYADNGSNSPSNDYSGSTTSSGYGDWGSSGSSYGSGSSSYGSSGSSDSGSSYSSSSSSSDSGSSSSSDSGSSGW